MLLSPGDSFTWMENLPFSSVSPLTSPLRTGLHRDLGAADGMDVLGGDLSRDVYGIRGQDGAVRGSSPR